MRKGMMVGRGKGYKNVMGRDPKVHSESARGMKQPQKVPMLPVYQSGDLIRNNLEYIGNNLWRYRLSDKGTISVYANNENEAIKKVGLQLKPILLRAKIEEPLEDYDDYLKKSTEKQNKKRTNPKVIDVDSIPEDYQFVSDSQDVEAIKDYLGKKAEGFDSFFVKVGEGDYDGVYGMEGTVPYTNKTVEKLR